MINPITTLVSLFYILAFVLPYGWSCLRIDSEENQSELSEETSGLNASAYLPAAILSILYLV